MIHLIHFYSFFNLALILLPLFSLLYKILFQPVFPYLMSLPLTLVTLCIFVSLYHSITALFLLLSFPLLFLDKCKAFLSLASMLLTSFHDFIPPLLLSVSPPLYLPTRLIITSSTVELMAQFRKGKKRRNHVLLLLEAESNATQETVSLFLAYVQYACT